MSTNEKDTLKRIRIANLSRLAELNGSRSRLAEILGKAPQQINDMTAHLGALAFVRCRIADHGNGRIRM